MWGKGLCVGDGGGPRVAAAAVDGMRREWCGVVSRLLVMNEAGEEREVVGIRSFPSTKTTRECTATSNRWTRRYLWME